MTRFHTRWLASVDSIQAVDRVATHVARAVQAGDLAPGTQLSVRELAERFETSTDMVHTALAALVADGSLVRHGNSILARPVERAELHRVYELRRALEPQLAAESVRSQSAAYFTKLWSVAEARDDPTAPMDARREASIRLRQMSTSAPQLACERRIMMMAWQQIDRFIPLIARTQPAQSDTPWPRLGDQFLDVYERRSLKAIHAWWQEYLDRSWLLVDDALHALAC